MDISYKSP